MIRHRQFIRVSGRGCSDCKAQIARLDSVAQKGDREDRSFRFECPSCHTVWARCVEKRMLDLDFSLAGVQVRKVRRLQVKFYEAQADAKCARCGKYICLLGTFGSWGEREPEGAVIQGAAYCWGCAGETMELVEAAAQSFGR